MGTYRLFLAVLVALSHLDVTFFGLNTGITAVVSFFLISGFVMTVLIRNNYPAQALVGAFYADRAMRLFPQFLFYMAATLVLVLLKPPVSPFMSDLTAGKVVQNLLMVPLNFVMWGNLGTGMLMPQAWSLGLEALFYVAIPWLVIGGLLVPAFVASAAVFLCAYFGWIDSDTWGYRLLPGTLFIFLAGSLMHGRAQWKRGALGALFLACLALAAALVIAPSLRHPTSLDVLSGLVVGIPVVALLKDARLPKWDMHLGNISYGVFLNHFMVIWAFEACGVAAWTWPTLVALFACSIVLAAITFNVIERPVIAMRHQLRKRADRQAGVAATVLHQ